LPDEVLARLNAIDKGGVRGLSGASDTVSRYCQMATTGESLGSPRRPYLKYFSIGNCARTSAGLNMHDGCNSDSSSPCPRLHSVDPRRNRMSR
jgi:hypothetical protein